MCEDFVQLFVLDQEAVVSHRRIDLSIDGIRNIGGKSPHILRRKYHIGGDADDYRRGGDTAERRLDTAASAPDIMRIESIQYRDIRIGIEPSRKFLALDRKSVV